MLLHVIKAMREDGSGAAAFLDNWRFMLAGEGEDRQRLQQNPGTSFPISPLLSAHMEAALTELHSGLLQRRTGSAVPHQHAAPAHLTWSLVFIYEWGRRSCQEQPSSRHFCCIFMPIDIVFLQTWILRGQANQPSMKSPHIRHMISYYDDSLTFKSRSD